MLNWNTVDTVLLDMDGTLIDQRLDNHFFHDMIPDIIAKRDNLEVEQVRQQKMELYDNHAGTLDFYCLDFWERELNLDLRALHHENPYQVTLRPGVESFLQTIHSLNKKVVLVTNAHPDSMNFKLARVPIRQYFNRCLSVHEIGMPKEHIDFWPKLQLEEHFDPTKTLFIDDNLPMLDSAKAFNIKHLFAIKQPDSEQNEKDTGEYYGLKHFDEITPKSSA